MEILRCEGTDKRLYDLVAPLVMNPAVLRQNNNYPFKTSRKYIWFIAMESGDVVGFMPVKTGEGRPRIDNYYIRGDRADTLDQLLKSITSNRELNGPLVAVVHKRHVSAFQRNGFTSYIEYKNYEKMDYNARKEI